MTHPTNKFQRKMLAEKVREKKTQERTSRVRRRRAIEQAKIQETENDDASYRDFDLD